jgi:hypothetical protein
MFQELLDLLAEDNPALFAGQFYLDVEYGVLAVKQGENRIDLRSNHQDSICDMAGVPQHDQRLASLRIWKGF